MSDDGVLKMWKKVFSLIEYIKSFKAHSGKITSSKFSNDHNSFYTLSVYDQTIKIFDLNLYDIQKIIKLDRSVFLMLNVSSKFNLSEDFILISSDLEMFELKETSKQRKLKHKIVNIVSFEKHSMFVTVDEMGFIEYFDMESWSFVNIEKNKVA